MKNKEKLKGKPNYSWSFKINLKATKKIAFFDSPSHKFNLLSKNNDSNEILLAMEES
jgi:hypothetical protein